MSNGIVVGAIQARMGSTRLPGKVLAPILGMPMVGRIIERTLQSKYLDKVIITTTTEPSDNELVEFAMKNNINCFRGSVDDIVDRLCGAANHVNAGILVRIWGDSPLTDFELIDQAVEKLLTENLDYVCSGIIGKLTFPGGVDIQVYTRKALEFIRDNTRDPFYREFPADYIIRNSDSFRWGIIQNDEDMSHIHLTVDYPEDLELIRALYAELYKEGKLFTFRESVELIKKQPDIFKNSTEMLRNDDYFLRRKMN